MAEELIIGLDGDDSKLRKTIDKVFDHAQKKGKTIFGGDTGGKGGAQSKIDIGSKAPSPGSQQAKADRERQRNEREMQKQGSLKYYGAGRQHTAETVETGQDIDELKGGGFYGAFERKFHAIKAGKDWIKDRFKRGDQDDKAGLSGSMGGMGGSLGSSFGGSNKYSSVSISANNVSISGGAGRSPAGVIGGGGLFPQRTIGGATQPQQTQPGQGGPDEAQNARSGLWDKLAKAAPYVGIPIAIAGGLMQLVSAAGQRYAQALGKQSGTLGATGGYIGGGGGFFGNAEVAQSSIALGKASGQKIFGTGGADVREFMPFAASQGESLSSVMGSVGQLRKASGGQFGMNELNQLRAEGYKAGFENLRESEFIQGIAQHSEQLRQQGVYNDPMKFAAFASSLQGSNMTADRRLGLAGTLAEKSLSGIQGGGIFGALSLVEAMKESNGDYFGAERLKDANPEKYISQALEQMGATPEGKNIRGFLMKKEGISRTMTEGMDLDFNRGQPGAAPGIQAEQSPITAAENLIDEKYIEVGKGAFEFSQQLLKDLADMLTDLKPAIETVSNGLKAVESKLGELAKTSAETVNSFVESLTEMQDSVKQAGGFKEWFKKMVKESLPFSN